MRFAWPPQTLSLSLRRRRGAIAIETHSHARNAMHGATAFVRTNPLCTGSPRPTDPDLVSLHANKFKFKSHSQFTRANHTHGFRLI